MENRLLVVEVDRDDPKTIVKLPRTNPQCVVVDPFKPETIYCGTLGQGLWKTEDSGANWTRIASFNERAVTALAVSSTERGGSFGVVYVGTEPSAIFRSEDGGDGWRRMKAFNELPSSATWSFPPRPHTHHVRWVGLDPTLKGRIYVAVEAGALVQSLDGGETWIDRVVGSPFDTHTLATHPKAGGRLYSAAGDGYFESPDYGESWMSPEDGLRHHYLHGLAVDPGEPDTIVISAASGPWSAHSASRAQSVVYRKVKSGSWEQVGDGLPDWEGTIVSCLTAGQSAGSFYLANNRGIYSSDDSGLTWNRLDVPWPEGYTKEHAWGIAVSGKG